MKFLFHARKAAIPSYRKLICHACAVGLFSSTVAPGIWLESMADEAQQAQLKPSVPDQKARQKNCISNGRLRLISPSEENHYKNISQIFGWAFHKTIQFHDANFPIV